METPASHLQLVYSTTLTPTSPFHFDATLHKPDYFPTDDSHWEPGKRWQAIWWRGRQVGIVVRDEGTIEDPAVRLEVYARRRPGRQFLASLTQELRYRFNLDLDLGPFYAAGEGDPALGPIIQTWRGLRPGHAYSLYEYLVIGVALQNTTVRRSIQMMRALFRAHGRLMGFDDRLLWCFWSPGALVGASEESLRALRVGYRARSLSRFDSAFASGEVDESSLRAANPAAQRRALLSLYGVGPATLGYLLTDVFHNWDHLDHLSPWEQRILSHLVFGTEPDAPVPAARLLRHFARYRPFRFLALHYLWEDLWWRHARGEATWLDPLIRT